MSDCPKLDGQTDVIQIVPGLPPSIDAVGHYAFALAMEMKKSYGVRTHFIVCKSGWKGADIIDGFPVYKLAEQTSKALYAVLSELCARVLSTDSRGMSVLLQMSAYGYHKQAFPFWLERGLHNWLNETPHTRLVTMFHELYASGPPWKKAFWASPLQRLVASRIAISSDVVFTSMQRYAVKIAEWDRTKAGKVCVVPVFSTIGEPTNVPMLSLRTNRLIVFGQRANRLRVYKESIDSLVRICELMGIEEINDIGAPIKGELPKIKGVRFLQNGVLPENEISKLMLDSRIGFFDYFPGCLAKSTIFSAYCAHGLVPVMGKENYSDEDGLIDQIHYCVPHEHDHISLDDCQSIADNARNWYSMHSVQRQAELFLMALTSDNL